MEPAALLLRVDRMDENMGYLIPGGKLLSFPVAQSRRRRPAAQTSAGPWPYASVCSSQPLQQSGRCTAGGGEIRGSESPDEVVIWEPIWIAGTGTGAQDNGTGVATVIDAAREVQSSGGHRAAPCGYPVRR